MAFPQLIVLDFKWAYQDKIYSCRCCPDIYFSKIRAPRYNCCKDWLLFLFPGPCHVISAPSNGNFSINWWKTEKKKWIFTPHGSMGSNWKPCHRCECRRSGILPLMSILESRVFSIRIFLHNLQNKIHHKSTRKQIPPIQISKQWHLAANKPSLH